MLKFNTRLLQLIRVSMQLLIKSLEPNVSQIQWYKIGIPNRTCRLEYGVQENIQLEQSECWKTSVSMGYFVKQIIMVLTHIRARWSDKRVHKIDEFNGPP